MDRMSRLLAALRIVLVALSVCFLGATSRTEHCSDPTTCELEARTAQADDFDLPDPSPAVAEERDEDPRGGSEDDVGHRHHTGLTWLPVCATAVHMIRGPPTGSRDITWRPRSSRGPPTQV